MFDYIYFFNDIKDSRIRDNKVILGNKAANLMNMCSIGLAVPNFFTISSSVCSYYSKHNKFPDNFDTELKNAVSRLEKITNQKLGDCKNPLIVSVRSGAQISMPGMMDTILNVGLTQEIVDKNKENEHYSFILGNYYKLLNSYVKIILGISGSHEECYDDVQKIEEEVQNVKSFIKERTGTEFPDDPLQQIYESSVTVIKSWNSPRAISYRRIHNINGEDLGTSVTIQKMVFGNLNGATGVMFTRNPSNGARELYGEYLCNAQGEDIVAGIKTPKKISTDTLGKDFPDCYKELEKIATTLEKHYKDAQDIEFTIENGKLYLLQTRSAKRTIFAAIKIAIDLFREGLIAEEEVLSKIDESSIDKLLHPSVEYNSGTNVMGSGLPASPGGASGILVFSSEEAVKLSENHDVILCRDQTNPDDIDGINAAKGIFTAFGGMTSHAAVVTRAMGKPCVCGMSGLLIDKQNGLIKINDKIVKAGEWISIDGNKGDIIEGKVSLKAGEFPEEFDTLMQIADKRKRINVRANADSISDINNSIKYGASGIGLCRTEHTLLEPIKLKLFRRYILSGDKTQKSEVLDNLKNAYVVDFENIFRITKDRPSSIRLLDPPLHEFIPNTDEDIKLLAESLNINLYDINLRLQNLKESNPMLGHRGCRLGITDPKLYEIQVESIFLAGLNILRETGLSPIVEITIPLVSTEREMEVLSKMVHNVAGRVMAKSGKEIRYSVGTMIELPRSCLIADKLAKYCDYFSFGTNDLTQTTYGISRDDISHFLPKYLEDGIVKFDPFVSIDEIGVGELMKTAIQLGKSANSNLKIGVCGEHGGDAKSIKFFNSIGVDYVSCSPYRIFGARLAAAKSNNTTSHFK